MCFIALPDVKQGYDQYQQEGRCKIEWKASAPEWIYPGLTQVVIQPGDQLIPGPGS